VRKITSYENGKKFGNENHFYEDGTIKMLLGYYNNSLHGQQLEFYPSGKIFREFMYCKGISVGPRKEWYESGKLKDIYSNSTRETYYENGQIKHSSSGCHETSWYEDGQWKSTTTRENMTFFTMEWGPEGKLLRHEMKVGGKIYPIDNYPEKNKRTDHPCIIYKHVPEPNTKYLECSFSEEHVMDYEFVMKFTKKFTLDGVKCVYCGQEVKNEVYKQV
jgi:hypothetical protein